MYMCNNDDIIHHIMCMVSVGLTTAASRLDPDTARLVPWNGPRL